MIYVNSRAAIGIQWSFPFLAHNSQNRQALQLEPTAHHIVNHAVKGEQKMTGTQLPVVIITGTPGAEGTALPLKSMSEVCAGEQIHISHHPRRVVSHGKDVKGDRPFKIMHSGPTANGGRFMSELGDDITIVEAVEKALAIAKRL